MANTLTDFDYFEPLEVTQGESVVWRKSIADFPATEWTAQYRFRGILGTGAGFNVTGTAEGSEFEFEMTAAQSAAAGVTTYEWQLWITNSDNTDETYQTESGRIVFKRGFSAGTTTAVDTRSQAEQILDAIDAIIETKATADQLEYEVSTPAGSRRLKRLSLAELLEARKLYAGIVGRQRRAERIRQGGSLFTMHRIRVKEERP